MRSLNSRVGAAVNRGGSAFSIWKRKSGIRFFSHCSPLFQSVEETPDFLPDLCPAGKSAPVAANQADQLVTLVDREHIILRCSKSSNMSNAIDEKRFHILLHFRQNRIRIFDIVPGLKRQQGLGRSRRAGIKRNYSRVRRASKKESHADRHHQAIPLAVGQTKRRQGEHTPWNAFIFRSHAAEQNGASITGA